MDTKRHECLPGRDFPSWVLGCLGTWVLASSISIFGCLNVCDAAEQASLIPEAEITALEREMAKKEPGDSVVRRRMTCKSIARKASALLEESPEAPNRFRVLAHMGLNNWQAALTAIDAAIAERRRASHYGARLSLGTVEMHFAKSTILKRLGRDREAGDERAVAERGLAWLEKAPDAESPPSYARNGIPVGVYDDLLKKVRSALGGRDQ